MECVDLAHLGTSIFSPCLLCEPILFFKKTLCYPNTYLHCSLHLHYCIICFLVPRRIWMQRDVHKCVCHWIRMRANGCEESNQQGISALNCRGTAQEKEVALHESGAENKCAMLKPCYKMKTVYVRSVLPLF